MSKLTTHVLDTLRGAPARGVAIELHRLEGEAWRPVARAATNADGRCEAPLLSGGNFAAGVYQLSFHVGDYFRTLGGSSEASPYLDIVPVRFTLDAEGGPYHVPLVVSPWAYSTYRGS